MIATPPQLLSFDCRDLISRCTAVFALFFGCGPQVNGFPTVASGESVFLRARYVPMEPFLEFALLWWHLFLSAETAVSMAFGRLTLTTGNVASFESGVLLTVAGAFCESAS